MPAAPPPPGPRPAWYRRLPPSLQRVAAASDRVTSLPLRAGPRLRETVAALQDVLLSEQVTAVEAVAQQIADDVCSALGVRIGDMKALFVKGDGKGLVRNRTDRDTSSGGAQFDGIAELVEAAHEA